MGECLVTRYTDRLIGFLEGDRDRVAMKSVMLNGPSAARSLRELSEKRSNEALRGYNDYVLSSKGKLRVEVGRDKRSKHEGHRQLRAINP